MELSSLPRYMQLIKETKFPSKLKSKFMNKRQIAVDTEFGEPY